MTPQRLIITQPDDTTTTAVTEININQEESSMKSWPEPQANLLGKWLYSYISPLLTLGSQEGKTLDFSDLYDIPSEMRTCVVHENFRRCYFDENRGIFHSLWSVSKNYFLKAAGCEVVRIISLTIYPLFVMIFLQSLESSNQALGIGMSCAIFLSMIITAFTNHRQADLATRGGVLLRNCVASAVYSHALHINLLSSSLTSGEVTNLVAIDAQKLFEVAQQIHLSWSCPLAIIIVTIELLFVMGPTTLIGVLVLVICTPIVKIIVKQMLKTRKKRIHITDQRIEAATSMLQYIKFTKLAAYEENFNDKITQLRDEEMKLVRKELMIWAVTLVITVLSVVFATAATFTAFVLTSDKNILTADITFTVLLLFAALRFPINHCGQLLGKGAQAYSAALRLDKFLSRAALQTQKVQSNSVVDETGEQLSIKDGSFVVGGNKEHEDEVLGNDSSKRGNAQFYLRKVNLNVRRSEVLAVVGPVGSGKSTLVNAIIGEIPQVDTLSTAVKVNGSIGYASQSPFILNASLRDNILFGSDFDNIRYEKVLDACCLREDIKQLGRAGDLTQIGERGVTLSGGQKQRVSLARVVYSCPDIALFDDPLSALDAETSGRVFENLFQSDLMSNVAVLLVTHAAHFLQDVDKILVLEKGEVIFQGTWNNLMSFEGGGKVLESLKTEVLEEDGDIGDKIPSSAKASTRIKRVKSLELSKPGKEDSMEGIMTKEERRKGLSSLETWLLWFKNAGGWWFITIQILFLALDRTAYVATEWWLAKWSGASESSITVFGYKIPSQLDGFSAQHFYLKVYYSILLVSAIATVLRSEFVVLGAARCSKRLFKTMTMKVLRAPMSYFETTPLGRILNRFTYDVEVLDLTLAQAMSVTIIAISWFIAGMTIMFVILPWIVLAILPILLTFFLMQLHYRKSSVDLKRLDAVSRSPIQAGVAECLDGAAIIRVFQQEDAFTKSFWNGLDKNNSAMLNFLTAHRWLGIRLELLGASVSLISTMVVASANDVLNIDPGIVALLIIWASAFTITLGFLIDHVNEAEASITSVERIFAMSQLPQEASIHTKYDEDVDFTNWPQSGEIEFRDVSLRYRQGLPLVLNKLSFKVESNKRCGVVGRTGAGKSSLTTALFRLVEIEHGQIYLDGVDLSKLGLKSVRGTRAMSIIPQDPVLFSGKLRQSLDPFQQHSDDAILQALKSVRLAEPSDGYEILDDIVEEGGINYSVGERQLLCLARALLIKPKVLVLDEATASVDPETDAYIQKMIRTLFKDTTLLTVAHRLHTIMDYDCILVLKDGKAVEFGSPHTLLLDKNGVFSELVESTGKESAALLRRIAAASTSSSSS